MNPKITTLAATMLLAGCPILLKAEDNAERFYVHADIGPVFIQDLTLHTSFGRSATHFEPGVRGDAAIGYNLSDSLAVETETGVLWNRVNSFNGFSASGTDLYQIPLLENLLYRIHLKHGWTPYVGGGVGADFTVFKTSVISRSGLPESAGGNDVTLGFQAKAGISYAISPNADIDFGYKFLGSLQHDWDVAGFRYKSDDIYTHAVLVSFCWKF